MFAQLLKRELTLTLRNAAGTALSVAFFALFIVLSGFALDGIPASAAPGLVWLAITFSALLSLDRLYRPDHECGALRHFHLAGVGTSTLVVAKTVAFILTGCAPLLLSVLIMSPMLNLSGSNLAGLFIALMIGLPAIAAYASFSAALLCGQRSAGLLGVIITTPFLIPILIFGIEAALAFPVDGIDALQFRILAGLSCIALALSMPMSMAALAANRGLD